jgi:Family of unknown function (DUF6308)
MTFQICGGKFRFSVADARLAVAGYAFGTRSVLPGQAGVLRGAFEPEPAPRWGYRTYDCVAASTGDDFTDLDILVASGLNGRLDVASVGALQLACRRAAHPLAKATLAGEDFANLTCGELAARPAEATTGWWLSEAWRQMMATPDVGTALTHKVLHHKRPALFPLLDNHTARALSTVSARRTAWQQIHVEIGTNRDTFEDLRSWFEHEAAARGGVALGLPRLHDVLLWLHVKGQWADAQSAGRAVLAA